MVTFSVSRGAAFFDVDETLISMKSMQSFLDFYFKDRSDGPGTPWQRFQRTVVGMSREEGNREYYRLWSGQSLSDVTKAGRAWFNENIQRPGFFVPPVLVALREHRRAGRHVFLISGSFQPCLASLALYLGISEVFCTDLVEHNGTLTGEIVCSRIGGGKRDAVEEATVRYGLDSKQSWAYGDHISDLPMLTAVGHPVVVGLDPQLNHVARQRKWSIISTKGKSLMEGTM